MPVFCTTYMDTLPQRTMTRCNARGEGERELVPGHLKLNPPFPKCIQQPEYLRTWTTIYSNFKKGQYQSLIDMLGFLSSKKGCGAVCPIQEKCLKWHRLGYIKSQWTYIRLPNHFLSWFPAYSSLHMQLTFLYQATTDTGKMPSN